MIRRSHKKSRLGCEQCKRSRKKCDETHPACVICITASKQCSYTRSTNRQNKRENEFVMYREPENLAVSTIPLPSITPYTINYSCRPLTPLIPPLDPYVNLLHLELFQNIICNSGCFFSDISFQDQWRTTLLQYTFSYPYLMCEVLAISAFRLSIQRPSKSKLYRTESITLQTQALSHFNSLAHVYNQDNIIPYFLFSAVLGLHVLCDSLLSPSPDLSSFLDRLVQSMQLLKGVRTMVGNSWEFIKNSDAKHLMQPYDWPAMHHDNEVTRAFEHLRTKFHRSDTLSTLESKVYCEAVTSLISVYNSQPLEIIADERPIGRMLMAWPIQVSAEYTEFLNDRTPEALVIMAYFSVLLHSRRAFWAVGNAGNILLTAIEKYLGDGWAEWLVVPRRLILVC
ncbi:hypothetical protein B0O99DRAFT_525418 [Bisporella sp. PMI_857]|nr:hypothetical protein B0O99DRAFT_525418 [Bisporella sp. PMI_857]